MRLQILTVLLVFSAGAFAAPGDLVSFKALASTPSDMIAGARAKICPALSSAAKAYGFKRFKVEYKTLDLKGDEVTSAGLILVPETFGKFPMVVYQHGTVFSRQELPSSSPFFGEGD